MITKQIADTHHHCVDIETAVGANYSKLPYSLRVLVENAVRFGISETAASSVAARDGQTIAFRPSRLLLHDMLGLPLLVDLMAMHSRVIKEGGDTSGVDMSLPVHLVCDHSMTISYWAEKFALTKNLAREFEVNQERFAFIKACEERFPNLRVIPPGGGIMHQINIEFLSTVAHEVREQPNLWVSDTCLGTDSHTPMMNGIGVLGWGIGGLEAEAILFGETSPVNVPRVIGMEMTGALSDDATATDIALAVAEKLRAVGVVDCFVEMFGAGYQHLSVADRSTVANMTPEYGATCVFCPVDDNTLRYLRGTGRDADHIANVEAYVRTQGLWSGAENDKIEYDDIAQIDLSSLQRTVAGPSRPEQRIDLADAAPTLTLPSDVDDKKRVPVAGRDHDIGHGDVIIAAITSCTNTANARNMILAGLVARNAVKRGMMVKPHVKTSLAPGSRVVERYLKNSGLLEPLSALGFQIAAFSCTTCNGMSGPLAPEIEDAINSHNINGVAVLSGNRNFPGRIHPLSSRNVIASPPLVVAYALAGTILNDISENPIGTDQDGNPVTLNDLWPDPQEVTDLLESYATPADFRDNYAAISTVNPHWNDLRVEGGSYKWPSSTYITFPPYIEAIARDHTPITRLNGLRPLAILGDSVTTDHISPSGTILPTSDAGKFLNSRGVEQKDFNSFGTRRSSSDIVVRSTFANVRLLNEMTPHHEGPWTRLEPEGTVVSMFEAIETYKSRNEELIIIGGKEYGCGSSRDTAAKAPWLAGVRAVIAESYERIHRSNLVNMGIAPLCFENGTNRHTLNLVGSETYDIEFLDDFHGASLTVHRADGSSETVGLIVRLYNDEERATFRSGGLLPRTYRSFFEAMPEPVRDL